jgi:hypothetical protein
MPAGVMAKNQSGGIYASMFYVPALGLLGMLLGSGQSRRAARKNWIRCLAGSLVFLITAACLLAASGCGSYGSRGSGNGTQRGTGTVVITGTSGSLSHSTSVSLTVQ